MRGREVAQLIRSTEMPWHYVIYRVGAGETAEVTDSPALGEHGGGEPGYLSSTPFTHETLTGLE